MRTNIHRSYLSDLIKTHEGAPAFPDLTPIKQLERTVASCLLWEDTFYESGISVSDRILNLIPKCNPIEVSKLAVKARTQLKLRHAPLWMTIGLLKAGGDHRKQVASVLESVCLRADEPSEFLSLYWKDGKKPLAAQVKKGLAKAMLRFTKYDLAKYDQSKAKVRPRDVMFLTHPKPIGEEQTGTFKMLANNTLPTPDTWEVAISAVGHDLLKKREVWTRLLSENKLGTLALIRNLRNMLKAGVSPNLIREKLRTAKVGMVLPFRFIAAARYGIEFIPELEQLMFKSLEGIQKLSGHTVLLVDISGSMNAQLSSKSEMLRSDAANGLAVLLREMCESLDVISFSDNAVTVPAHRGFALVDAINKSQPHCSTNLGRAVEIVNKLLTYDRLIVITDEQSHDRVPGPKGKGYMINVASYQNGVGYGPWTHIDGFSEAVLSYIRESEAI